ncbi:unnamed protein product [Effrenium voratum]|uniref:Uncharacterized protein n=1 Tax=Effrenium voratum TaxID=2562239 RepID=A0AA36ILC3_9DINO|nr:unnamed protein product [Effrenium voratum]CAJ1389471.1 unnamed protein product [Effrenium voratum]CAJ1429756.1 unnamed protein product [Effrenium voratum]
MRLAALLLLTLSVGAMRDVLDEEEDDPRAEASQKALLQMADRARRSSRAQEAQGRLQHAEASSDEADADADSEDEDDMRETTTPPSGEDLDSEDEDGDPVESDRDAFAKTAADHAGIVGAIDEFDNATKVAQGKAKDVDDKFARYNGRIGELHEELNKLTATARSYHLQTIKWFKDAEKDKYSPIVNMPLDTFKISKSPDDFPLESVSGP